MLFSYFVMPIKGNVRESQADSLKYFNRRLYNKCPRGILPMSKSMTICGSGTGVYTPVLGNVRYNGPSIYQCLLASVKQQLHTSAHSGNYQNKLKGTVTMERVVMHTQVHGLTRAHSTM